MSEYHGTRTLVIAAFRRDRVRIAVWVGAITFMVFVSASGVKQLFPTQADLDTAAAASTNPAIIAFNGPPQALDTLGGQVAFQIGSPGLVLCALMAILMVGRLTRGEEESGRLELVRSLPVGRRAPVAAAAIVVGTMGVVLGALVGLALVSQSLGPRGSLSFGLGYMMITLVFMAVTLVTAQISENVRVVYGSSGCVLGAAFVLRAFGDVRGSVLSWFSPIGWMQHARPFAGERWWPFLLGLAATAGLLAVARSMLDHRDLDAGLFAPKPGRPRAGRFLGGPVALDMRLQRGSVLGWAFGLTVTGVAYGSISNSIESFVQDNPTLSDLFTGGGAGSLIDAYLATSTRVSALIGAGFAVQSMLRLRSEEVAMRADPVLAAAVSRTRWALGHLVTTVLGSIVVLGATGLSLGVSAALVTNDRTLVLGLTGAALAYAPAVWVLVGFALALSGLAPRWTGASWAILMTALVVTFLGPVLSLPRWAFDLSPFEHVPLLPAADLALLPLLVLGGISVALAAIGVVGLRRRDIG